MIPRIIKLPKNYSFFLFGPRGVGKTTLLKNILPKEETVIIDLLDYNTEVKILSSPGEFKNMLNAAPKATKWILIDEVQKIPRLLDEVHRQIENQAPFNFAIIGSSARKLKRGQANLLAGRAFTYSLHPLTSIELGASFNLDNALEFGTLPKIVSWEDVEHKSAYLQSYAKTYLAEEIQQEGIVRNLTGFKHFLPLVATETGNALSWSNIAQDVGIDSKTVRSYFQILEDTLIGFFLPAYRRSIRSRQKTHPKFYLFDTGVKRAVEGSMESKLIRGTSEYGKAFEHFWISEIIRLSAYKMQDCKFSYFATHDTEVDLVIERAGKILFFIEIKSSENVRNNELRTLNLLIKSTPQAKAICISREPLPRKVGNVLVCPWRNAAAELELI
ncbi:MAG: AAA family ATPase [Patescibacteria group bacterium]